MDLPPSGWYPDPYGTPRLLRWWDGTSWTPHTHPDPTAGGTGPAGGEAATRVQSTAVQSTAVQSAVHTPAVESTTVGATAVQPSPDWLRRTRPPTGPATAPQPALPASPGVAATAVQSPVQPTAVQPAVQPTAYQPAAFQPTGGAGVNDGGTQVLFVGEDNPWTLPGGLRPGGPGGPGGPGYGGPGGPGGPGYGNRYGYLEAQQRRRRWMIAGVAAGTAVAVSMIAIIASNLGASSSTGAQSTPTPHKHKTTAPAASASPSPTASATASNSSLLSDGQSGLAYPQLAQPWQGPSCPSSLSSSTFTWTAGEYAVAGQVNGGTATWYGEACSGPLPVQFGYQGAANLQPTTAQLATAFENAYYNGLDHTITPGLSQPISVSGHAAWEVTYQVSYTNAAQGATWTDEQAAVVVVDPGTGNEPSVFFTSVPGNLNEGNVTNLVSSLQYSAPLGVTNPAATPSNASSDGSGGGNPGNGNGNGHGGGDGANP